MPLPAQKHRVKEWGDTLVLGALFIVIFLSFRQETFYLYDGFNMVMRLSRFSPASALHPFPDILSQWVSLLLAPLGLRPFAVLGALNGCGVAIAVMLSHRFFHSLEMGRWRAMLSALLVGSTPNVFFFATVVEVHGIFLPFAVAGLWALTLAAMRGGIPRFALAALLCGFASFVHSSMHVLLPFYLLWMDAFAAERDKQNGMRNPRYRWRRAIVFMAAYGGMAILTRMGFSLAGLLAEAPLKAQVSVPSSGLKGLAERIGPLLLWPLGQLKGRTWADLPYLFLTPVREWILPSLPVSLAFLFAWRRKPLAPLVCRLLAGLAILSIVAYLMLNRFVEYGAYFLPLVIPASYLAGKSLPKPATAFLVLLGFVGGISWVKIHDRRPFEKQAHSFADLEKSQGKLLVLADWLTDPVFLSGIHAFRKSQIWFLREFGVDALPPSVLPSLVERLGVLGKTKGDSVKILLTKQAIEWLSKKGSPPARKSLLQALQDGFRWTEVNNSYLLQPKGD